ncbi:hypothetical protein ACWOBE_06260 [Hutsoniella sourekii]
MRKFIKTLQHPLLKIFLGPLALIVFGLSVGIARGQQISWLHILLLYLIVFLSELLDHFFYLKFIQHRPERAPQALQYLCQIGLVLLTITLSFSVNWSVILLLIAYYAFLHLKYFPFPFTGSLYEFVLAVFFNGFVLNALAYATMTGNLNQSFLTSLVPIILVVTAVNLSRYQALGYLKRFKFKFWGPLSLILAIIASIYAFSQSLPSHSFYLCQIVFLLISLASAQPLIVSTYQTHQCQNKINYLSTFQFFFCLSYALAYIF